MPAPLPRNRGQTVVEILIVGFKETIILAVEIKIGANIRTEQDTICILEKEAPRRIGLATQFANTFADVYVEVRAFVQQLPHPSQIFGIAAHVRADEGGLWVSGNQIGKGI